MLRGRLLLERDCFLVKWGTSSRWSSSLCCLVLNSDQMTIRKTHFTVNSLIVLMKTSKLSKDETFLYEESPACFQNLDFNSYINTNSVRLQSCFKYIKWGASSRWSFRPNSALGSIETSIRKTRPTLFHRTWEYQNSSQFTEQTGHYEFIRVEENSSNSKWKNHLDHLSVKILECGKNGIRWAWLLSDEIFLQTHLKDSNRRCAWKSLAPSSATKLSPRKRTSHCQQNCNRWQIKVRDIVWRRKDLRIKAGFSNFWRVLMDRKLKPE